MIRRLLGKRSPMISIIVVIYDMTREAPRTLFTLSPSYQQCIDADDYEVIVIDNGSPEPLGDQVVCAFGDNFHYHYIEDASPSPAHAVNLGVEMARGEVVGIMVDGARMLSPGVLHYAMMANRMYPDPIVATLAWHLGHEAQMASVRKGYNQQVEDQLLDSVMWQDDGYQLFRIAAFAGSSAHGFFIPIAESNCFFMRKKSFEAMHGFDERFDMPGGGLVNLDFYVRACKRDAPLVMLIGEGTFHQVHGGIATNTSEEEVAKHQAEVWWSHYKALRGEPFKVVEKEAVMLGHVRPEVLKFIAASTQQL